MEAAKHNPEFAKKMGIPQSVAAELVAADKRAGKYQKRSRPSGRPIRDKE